MNFQFKVGDIIKRKDGTLKGVYRFIIGIKVLSNRQASYEFYNMSHPDVTYSQGKQTVEAEWERVNERI